MLFHKQFAHLNRCLRIAVDDKVYLKCGTSEGFSRPLHKPVQLSDNDMKLQLLTPDYPQSFGYVSPGVMLTVNQMNKIEHIENDKYSPSNIAVSVKCKPKMIYPSDGTNSENNLYENRLIFHDENEISENENTPRNTQEYIPEDFIQTVIFLRDSLLQFDMTIEDNFIRLKNEGDHLKREKLRLTVLSKRIESILKYNDGHLISTVTNMSITYFNFGELKKLKQKLNNLADIISSDVTFSKNFLINSFNELTSISRSI